MLRLATVYDDWMGSSVSTSESDEVTARVIQAYVDAQCWVVRMHGGECADMHHVFNGPEGTGDAGPYLGPEHSPHLNPAGPSGCRRRAGPARLSPAPLTPDAR